MHDEVQALIIADPKFKPCAPSRHVRIDTVTDASSFEMAMERADIDIVIVHQELGWSSLDDILRAVHGAWPWTLRVLLVRNSDSLDVDAVLRYGLDELLPPAALSSDALWLLARRAFSASDITELVGGRGPTLVGIAARVTAKAPQPSAGLAFNLEHFFESSPDMLVIFGPDGYFKRVNSACEALLGYSMEELTSRPYLSFVHSDDLQETKRAARRLQKGHALTGFENRFVCKDGSVKWIQWTLVPESEQLVYATARDVTLRKKAQERLQQINQCLLSLGSDGRKNIQRLTVLCGSLMDADFAVYNRCQGDHLICFAQWRTPSGFEPVERVRGRLGADTLRSPKDRLMVIRNLSSTRYAKTDPNVPACGLETFVGRVVRANRHALGSLCAFYGADYVPDDSDDRIMGIIASAISVEERRLRAIEALAESEERFRQFAENIHEVFWMTDPATEELVYVSPVYEKIWGRSRESLYHEPESFTRAIHENDRARVLDALRTKPECGDYREEYRIVRPDGSMRWILDTAFPVRDGDGRVIRIAGVAEDVTEHKLAQEALRRSEEQLLHAQKMDAIGRLAGGVAHDFNNMLTAISGYSDLVLGKLAESDPVRQDVAQIRHATDRAASLTRQLLAFSRRQLTQPKVIDLNSVIRNLERILSRLVGDQVELSTDLAANPGNIRADAGQLEQVLVNIAVNSRDAMTDGGVLTIRTENVTLAEKGKSARFPQAPAGNYILLSFADSGHGMDTDTLSHIFEPFYTTKPVGEGTGLGLSTVYRIVVQQGGGFIDVDSAPGRGTCFNILLPRVNLAAEEPETGLSMGMPHGTETILVVEDEEMVRTMVHTILINCGYEVLTAARADEALQVAHTYDGKIHLLLTDIVMPRMGGEELARRMRTLRPETRILFMSGYSRGLLQDDIRETIPFLQKPFKPESLLCKVREVLDAETASPTKAAHAQASTA